MKCAEHQPELLQLWTMRCIFSVKDYGIFRGQSYDEPQKIRGKNVHDGYPYKEFYVEGTEEIEMVLLRLDSFWNVC